ncbi:hypothetical protein K461DRAFT_131893 [Myriangium duriaei CBS 260.36]|uniref:Uncharacterized protein n=1 Tax=Myriangium duriaei CBS 260.36 TaxID=1168546 RepID=A0A9P4J0J5_9PEZI|nr:hypothetical protein K461DRAFT_131893 [Myriangium duriaei CBS 260.36]
MTDNLNPTGPSQPSLDDAYTTPGNPAQQEPAEAATARANAKSPSDPIDHRRQNDTSSDPTPSSLGQGVRRPHASGEEAQGRTHEDVGRHNELDAEQMAAPGEGRIASAVDKKPGASGAQPGLESDLDRKKAEQAPAREAVKDQRQKEVDVGGVLGQRGGPANPVDKEGYPNAGS